MMGIVTVVSHNAKGGVSQVKTTIPIVPSPYYDFDSSTFSKT